MDEEPRFQWPLPVWATLTESLRVYRLLFLRSVTTAAVVFAGIALIDIGHHAQSGSAARALALLAAIGTLAGPLIVQGALVEIVRNVHEGRPPERVRELFRRGRARFGSLLGASIIYALGIFAGLILFLVPGMIVAARWSLLAPLVMLENRSVGDARRRSSALVKGHTGSVLGCVILSFIAVEWFPWALLFSHMSYGSTTFLTFVWSALTAPFQAHVLTVIYYRLADPDRPVIDPRVHTWRSVWEGR